MSTIDRNNVPDGRVNLHIRDNNNLQHKIQVRAYGGLLGRIMCLIGKAIKLEVNDGKANTTLYVNKRSLGLRTIEEVCKSKEGFDLKKISSTIRDQAFKILVPDTATKNQKNIYPASTLQQVNIAKIAELLGPKSPKAPSDKLPEETDNPSHPKGTEEAEQTSKTARQFKSPGVRLSTIKEEEDSGSKKEDSLLRPLSPMQRPDVSSPDSAIAPEQSASGHQSDQEDAGFESDEEPTPPMKRPETSSPDRASVPKQTTAPASEPGEKGPVRITIQGETYTQGAFFMEKPQHPKVGTDMIEYLKKDKLRIHIPHGHVSANIDNKDNSLIIIAERKIKKKDKFEKEKNEFKIKMDPSAGIEDVLMIKRLHEHYLKQQALEKSTKVIGTKEVLQVPEVPDPKDEIFFTK